MEIKTKMKLSNLSARENENGEVYYLANFLDNNDDKFTFFIDDNFYNELSKHKQYDFIDLEFNLYKSNKGRYGLSLL